MINVGNTNQLNCVLVVLVSTMFVLVGCASPEEVLPGVGPAEQFVRNGDHLQVYGEEGASRHDLFPLSIFGRYTPGSHAPVAIQRFGQPDRWIDSAIIEYTEPQGRYRMGKRLTNTHGASVYPVWFYPNDRSLSTILPQYIIDHLRPSAEKENVHVYECGYARQFMTVVLESSQVSYVVLRGNPGKRKNAQQCTP